MKFLIVLLLLLSITTSIITPAKYIPVATATYYRHEYVLGVHHNMQVASAMANMWFSIHDLEFGRPYSYLKSMENFSGPLWVYAYGILGAGACETSTVLYRAAREYNVLDVSKRRDGLGNDTITGLFLRIRKFDHDPPGYNYPADKLAVYYNSPGDPYNREFSLTLVRGKFTTTPPDLKFKIFIEEQSNGDFIATVYSNYNQYDLIKQ